jgi:hypothetical protein
MSRWVVVLLSLSLLACGSSSDVDGGGDRDASATPMDLAQPVKDGPTFSFVDGNPNDPGLPDLASPLSIVSDPMPYDSARLAEMAQYSLAHYGVSTYVLVPQLIVLHFTDGPSFSSAYNLFASNASNRGELPGTCAHYIVEQDGTIHGLVDTTIRCRHAVGVNHVAIGIEMVQDSMGKGGAWADQQILNRPAQIDAVLHLVHWLQARYGIATDHVIGHAMANDSPLFLDLEGWTNDHDDWGAADVTIVRQRLDALP